MASMGGKCSILAGVIYIISGIVYSVYQVGRFDWNSIASISAYLQTVPDAEMMWGIVNLGSAFAAFLAIAGVLALSDRLRPYHEGFMRWAATLAIIGYSISAITNVSDYYTIKRLATNYSQIDPSARPALEAIGIGSLDPTLSLQFMTVGPWFLSAGWFSMRKNLLPKPLAWSGLFAGIAALLFVVATFLEIQSMAMPAIGITLIFHPLWLIWMGLVLWQERG